MMIDVIFVISVLTLAFLSWILYISHKERKDPAATGAGYIFGAIILFLAWVAVIIGIVERIRSGGYPLEILRILGIEAH